MKKAIKRNAVRDLIKMGIYTKKDIAEQLGITTGSVAVHMTYLRWRGHFIIYDLDSRVLRMTTKKGCQKWLDKKVKTPLTSDEVINKLTMTLKRLYRTQNNWWIKAHKQSLSVDESKEVEAQLTIHEISIKRIETMLWEAKNQHLRR